MRAPACSTPPTRTTAFLARGPRFRLAMPRSIRDSAHFRWPDLLDERGRRPEQCYPYHPKGLLDGDQQPSPATTRAYPHTDDVGHLYRRSLYTFWKRTAPPPFMMNFDSAGREACVVQQTRTNTPLQALNLMNDVTYVEAARKIAERMLKEGGGDPIGFAFRSATARQPKAAERNLLTSTLDHYRARYAAAPDEAAALLNEGESERDKSLDPAEHAAHTAVASLILNMDEVMTKE